MFARSILLQLSYHMISQEISDITLNSANLWVQLSYNDDKLSSYPQKRERAGVWEVGI